MGPAELLRWQWASYPATHATRANLLLHLCTAPFFWVGTLLLLWALFTLNWPSAVTGVLCLSVTVLTQGFGHRRLENQAPAPFTSPWNFMGRIFLEQWITFPRFLLSGGWWTAFDRDS